MQNRDSFAPFFTRAASTAQSMLRSQLFQSAMSRGTSVLVQSTVLSIRFLQTIFNQRFQNVTFISYMLYLTIMLFIARRSFAGEIES
jgi:hypothetical protein